MKRLTPQQRWNLVALVLSIVGYFALSSITPKSTTPSPYHFPLIVLLLVAFSIIGLLLLCWIFGYYAWLQMDRYTQRLPDGTSRQAFTKMKQGIWLLTAGLIISSLMGGTKSFYASSAGLTAAENLLNYLVIALFPFLGFMYLRTGSRKLAVSAQAAMTTWSKIITVGPPVLILAVFYGYLAFTNTSNDSQVAALGPAGLLILRASIVLVVGSWIMGLLAALNIERATHRGVSNMQAHPLGRLYTGILTMTGGFIILDALISLGSTRLGALPLVAILILAYTFIGVVALGFFIVALSARQLVKGPFRRRKFSPMQLIQKMLLTLLSIGLLPAFMVSSIIYFNDWSSLQSTGLSQIGAIATIQQGRAEKLIALNKELVTSYTNRATLQAVIARYNEQGEAADAALLGQSVNTLQAGNKSLKSVSILSPDGMVVASTTAANVGRSFADRDYVAHAQTGYDVTSNIFQDDKGGLSLYLTGPFMQNGRLIGMAVIESDMSGFLDLTQDYTGLGSTGETMLALRDDHDNAVYVMPLRFDKTAAMRRSIDVSETHNPMLWALDKKSGGYSNATDYRGVPVLAATRYIPEANWGMVVKIDQSEAYKPLAQLSNLLVVVLFILSVVIIFVAFYLARSLNEPILALAVAADRIRDGMLSARAQVTTKDEIGQLASTFNAMADNVEKVDQLKSEFVLLTSHQLRTPATAVKGFMSMLLDGYAGKITKEQKELLDAAYTENERQISVINSILDVGRMEAGEMVLAPKHHDMGELIDASADGQKSLVEAHGQTLVVIKPKHQVILWVDPEKLQLVVDNLIHNAIKYSPRGTRITVELKQDNENTTIEVQDQGIGIAQRDLGRLFKRFSRIPGPHTTNIQGAGLGLYLAEKLTTMHGGTIDVHSQEGVGTRFTITLPNAMKGDSDHDARSRR